MWIIALPSIRRSLIDDRLVLARTIARSLDGTISTAIQDLGRLATDLPEPPDEMVSRLRAFRFQSPFHEASYVLDSQYALVAADPATVRPLPASWLGYHEAVTPLVYKPGETQRPVLALVHPFSRRGSQFYLVSEMDPQNSILNPFLKDLNLDRSMRVVVMDDKGTVVASPDPGELFQTLPDAETFADRIRAHRPLVTEDLAVSFAQSQPAQASLTVMAPMRFAAWGVVLQQPNTTAFTGLNTTSRGLLLSGLALALIGVLLARTLSRSVVSPIRQLSAQATAMRAGDLSSPISVSGDVEVELLAQTLDDARARLAATLTELQAFNQRLEEQVAARTAVIVQQDEQRKILVRRMLAATEDERRRLARELHDETAQLLTVIQLSLHRVNVDTPEMRHASELLVRTQKEIHRIIHDLRPSLLDDLGLPTAMKAYADEHLTHQGLRVHLEIDAALPPRPDVETVIFRIYQELVTNVLRHAQAEQVSIELYDRNNTRILTVEDDGVGFDPEARSNGAGMTGMRERAALVNGTIRFESEPGVGTQVTLEIPLP